MRLIMMGTGPFAVPTFESLLASDHEVIALITRPSVTVQTRGKPKAAPNPMRNVAEQRNIRVWDPADVNNSDSRQVLASLNPDLFVVCDYGQILSPETLLISPLGGINLHGSLLPKYRGAAPVNWAIWKGESETGVTVLHMTPKLDAGPSLVQVTTQIGPDETAHELETRLAKLGIEPVHQALAMLTHWDRKCAMGHAQDPSLATRARRLKKTDGLADWNQPAEQVYRQFRAVQPWPGFFTYWQSSGREPVRLSLQRISIVHLADERALQGSLVPGTVAGTNDGRMVVAASSGAIAIHNLQSAGSRLMDTAEFLRGHAIKPGDVMG